MRKTGIGLFLILGFAVGLSAQADEKAGKGEGPCKQIVEACKNAGFKKGDWKNGDGLWRDCVDPIMQGTKQVPGSTKPLPNVDPNLIAECKEKHGKFGEGKVGSK